MEKARPSLEEVFYPRGVAIVGASPVEERNSFTADCVRYLKQAGFPAIYPVNPRHRDIFGLPCYPSLTAIPGVVDHVIVGIPAGAVLALLDECAAKGVRSVQFFTAGFSESGYAEGARLEKAMLERARSGGFRIIGPNCVGLVVPGHRLIIVRGVPPEPGPIAFISQSGGHTENVPYHGGPRGLRFSKIVSYGNALDVDESELLHYLARDPQTEIIAAYIEGVKDGKQFVGALREAASCKPVVIYKGGMTAGGSRGAKGHTGSLATSPAIFAALCKQAGAILVDNIDEMMDVLVALRFLRPIPRGYGVAVVGVGGGPSVLAGDEMERNGLRLPPLSDQVQTELRQVLPLPGSIFSNPVDAIKLLNPDALSATLSIVGRVPDIHLLVYHLGFHPVSRWGRRWFIPDLLPIAKEIAVLQRKLGKPIIIALHPALDLSGIKDFLTAQEAFVGAGLAVFHSLRQAARAVSRVVAWQQAKP